MSITETNVEPLWTPADVAAYLQCSLRMIRRLHRNGTLPPARMFGTLPRWVPSEVRAWVEAGVEAAAATVAAEFTGRGIAAGPDGSKRRV